MAKSQKTKAERAKQKKVNAAKRANRLAEVQKKDPKRVACMLNFAEYKKHVVSTPDNEKREEPWTDSYSDFCKFKAGAYHAYWMDRSAKPRLSEKSIERKKAAAAKAKAKLEKMRKELEALGIKMEDVEAKSE